VDYPVIEPDEKKMDRLVTGIQKKFGLELLGIDVIIENSTGRYGVIDINAFPGTVMSFFIYQTLIDISSSVCFARYEGYRIQVRWQS